MIPRIFLIWTALVLAGPAWAEETETTPSAAAHREAAGEASAQDGKKPEVIRLKDGRLRLGKVTFNPKTREIEIPTVVNMTEGLLEFLLVRENGKVHESLLVTDVSAVHLNLAFKLLRYQASPERYLKVNEDASLSNVFESASDEQKRESRIDIFLRTGEGEAAKEVNACEWVGHVDKRLKKVGVMPAEPWIYGGSLFYEGQFVAETSGDLIAIFLANSALINYSGKDSQDDEVWPVRTEKVPPLGSSVTLLIRPHTP